MDTNSLFFIYDMNLVEFNELPSIEITICDEGQRVLEGVIQWKLKEGEQKEISSVVDDVVDCVSSHRGDVVRVQDEHGEWMMSKGGEMDSRISVAVIDGCVLFIRRVMDWSGYWYHILYRDCFGNFWTNMNEEYSLSTVKNIRDYFKEQFPEYW